MISHLKRVLSELRRVLLQGAAVLANPALRGDAFSESTKTPASEPMLHSCHAGFGKQMAGGLCCENDFGRSAGWRGARVTGMGIFSSLADNSLLSRVYVDLFV